MCDLAGATQTQAAHDAVKKVVRLDGEGDLDAVERYLWALGTGAQPKLEILKGINHIIPFPPSIPVYCNQLIDIDFSFKSFRYSSA